MKLKFFFVSEIVPVPLNKELLKKIFFSPFSATVDKIRLNSATNSSGQHYFSPAPFELFGRNFGHLATLHCIASWGLLGQVSGIGDVHIYYIRK